MNTVPLDPLYTKAMKFAEVYNRKNHSHGISNLYVIRKFDLEGNEIGETYYGSNLMTDYGMQQVFTNQYDLPKNFFIGNGSGSITYDSAAIINPIVTSAATLSNSTISYEYPVYYDSITGLITTVAKFITCYFDYTVSGIDTDVTITEYGLGTTFDALYTHSWVYDNLGNRATVIKKLNERLVIDVYVCMSYYESLITSEWENGHYICITNPARFLANKMKPTGVYAYKRNNVTSSIGIGTTQSALIDSKISIYNTIDTRELQPGSDASQGYVEGFSNWYDGCNMIEREVLSVPESFDTIQKIQVDYYSNDDCFTYNFGHANYLPITSIHITNSYAFNYLTGEYDIAEQFLQSGNYKWYCETFMQTIFATTLRITNNNTVTTMYLYRNMNISDPIIAINTDAATVYATDKYWDTSSFQLITDHTSVPANLQHAKYWISGTKLDISPVRGNQPFVIKPASNQYKQTYLFSSLPSDVGCTCSSFDDHWFAVGSWVYRPTDYTIIKFGSTSATIQPGQSKTFGYGPIVVCANGSSLRYVDMSQETPSILTDTNASILSNAYNSYFTETGTGFLMLHNGTSALKVDIRNGSYVSTQLTNIQQACAIWGTNTYACISTTTGEEHIIYIKNFTDDSVVQTFALNSSDAIPSYLFGYKNQIYVTDASTYTYACDILNGTINLCDNIINFEKAYVRFTFTDACMIVYRYNDTSMSTAYAIRNDSPTSLINLSALTKSYSYSSHKCLNLVALYSNTLVLCYAVARTNGSHYFHTIDFGHFLYDETVDWLDFNNSATPFIPYGNANIIKGNVVSLISNLIPHRFIGTTNTITSYNKNKYLSDKSWVLTVTNVNSDFQGLPPGNIQ